MTLTWCIESTFGWGKFKFEPDFLQTIKIHLEVLLFSVLYITFGGTVDLLCPVVTSGLLLILYRHFFGGYHAWRVFVVLCGFFCVVVGILVGVRLVVWRLAGHVVCVNSGIFENLRFDGWMNRLVMIRNRICHVILLVIEQTVLNRILYPVTLLCSCQTLLSIHQIPLHLFLMLIQLLKLRNKHTIRNPIHININFLLRIDRRFLSKRGAMIGSQRWVAFGKHCLKTGLVVSSGLLDAWELGGGPEVLEGVKELALHEEVLFHYALLEDLGERLGGVLSGCVWWDSGLQLGKCGLFWTWWLSMMLLVAFL